MREILFRGKFVNEWKYGYLSVEPKGLVIKEPYNDNKSEIWHIALETVGQYTGLTDKNGRKIFEGDILQCNNNPIDLVKAVYGAFGVIDVETETAVDNVIGWHYEVIPTDELSKVEPFCLPMPLTEYYINRCTMVVIGNIYDNPELLKGSETCSVCGDRHGPYNARHKPYYNYCPNCGAKMDEEEAKDV